MRAIIKLYNDPDALEKFEVGLQSFTEKDYAELIALLSSRLNTQLSAKDSKIQNNYTEELIDVRSL